MTVDEVYELITANKNHKKYTIEKNDDSFTLTFGPFRMVINKVIADNIETELPYTYLDSERVERVAKIHDLENDINVLLSRDWEPQTYMRGFHVFIGEPEENGQYDVEKYLFFNADWYDLIDDVEIDGNFTVTKGFSDADKVLMYTISSLPKGTLSTINNLNAKEAITSGASTYSSKYTDWYGYGFSKDSSTKK